MTVAEFLENRVAFLNGITPEQARVLGRAAGQRVYSQGETVVLKGTRLEGLHVVAAGRVCAYLRPEKDKEWIKVAELGAGQVFGEGAILGPESAVSTIKSGAPDTVVFVVPAAAFAALFEADPALQERISALIESRRGPAHKPPPSP